MSSALEGTLRGYFEPRCKKMYLWTCQILVDRTLRRAEREGTFSYLSSCACSDLSLRGGLKVRSYIFSCREPVYLMCSDKYDQMLLLKYHNFKFKIYRYNKHYWEGKYENVYLISVTYSSSHAFHELNTLIVSQNIST